MKADGDIPGATGATVILESEASFGDSSGTNKTLGVAENERRSCVRDARVSGNALVRERWYDYSVCSGAAIRTVLN